MPVISKTLLHWYAQNKRSLPWRDHPDPYAVWVSEIMLQQTRVESVIPYFKRWMARFPDIASLAAADEQDVLNLWEGLGYYSRARNLHRAAKILYAEHDASLPRDPKSLRALPGIGRYTAAAIASMAFGQNAAALDGNIRRVYARLFNVDEPLGTTAAEKIFWGLAEQHLPHGKAGDYNQALMDLGSAICTPRSPDCENCPLSQDCEAWQLDLQEMRPVPKAKKAVPHYTHAAAVIMEAGKVLLAQRPREGLLGGMWEFPNARVEGNSAEGLADAILNAYQLHLRAGDPLCTVDHAYTHFKVRVDAFSCTMLVQSPLGENMRWVNLKDLGAYPMGKIARKIAGLLTS